jgi:flagellar basal-body rod protein FlgC
MPVDPIAISRSALDVEWQRLQIVAQNLANQNSARVAGSAGYRALTLVSGPSGGFGRLIEPGGTVPAPAGVRVLGVEPQRTGLRRIYDPGHPEADGEGFVTLPDVNVAGEMALLVKAARVYESNLAALSLAQQMARRALEMGSK